MLWTIWMRAAGSVRISTFERTPKKRNKKKPFHQHTPHRKFFISDLHTPKPILFNCSCFSLSNSSTLVTLSTICNTREASKRDVKIGENPGQPTTPRKGGGPCGHRPHGGPCANSSPDELSSIPSPKTLTQQPAGPSTAGKSKNRLLIAGNGLNVNFKPQIPVFIEKLRLKQTKQPSN